ncbi:patatin-like phospholipase family protein [Cocleimonas sp. KMM 6892]|uniref:patatin-like phospholipase family protein n=1 Tax=unclassified Cocleimonas TaxID=2639732 RepID=UPI002DB806FE|nr:MULTISPECIES: patatin-like phospholipase family protein [unclassified Cocleimonas]MEB8433134.1 patatin-like phospholipase family protein [Cocleimonas sp. KMM 6892]MEC4715885.1 patatin-like phospholipase family protein [Cocleimonas sp. KMM 6895]MEC4745346.1 patatin-like phospholipase family protein [Cocleimonas sp. KMM 6896]
MNNLKIGLALGSGSSRGWSHIGVINALIKNGIEPDIVCGTSIGALVGASYVNGKLDELEKWATSLTKFESAKLYEINSSLNGFVNTKRLHALMQETVAAESTLIEDLPKKFATIATDLDSGREIWLKKGSVLEAVWSSISLPGLFPAVRKNDQWLVDGGLVNPVPVSTCRALGADLVIAVNLNGDLLGRHMRKNHLENLESKETKRQELKVKQLPQANSLPALADKFTSLIGGYTPSFFSTKKDKATSPSLFETIASSVNITQDRITKSRMVGDPPEIIITPHLAHIGIIELYRAKEAIEEGEKCVNAMLPEIKRVLGL